MARQVPFGTLFFAKLFEACSLNHVIVLCEGSTLKSKFADALTLYSCEAAGIARAQGKPCIAFGSEIGAMNPSIERAARDLCSNAMDERLDNLADELGTRDELLLHVDDAYLAERVLIGLDSAYENRIAIAQSLADAEARFRTRLRDMYDWLVNFVRAPAPSQAASASNA